MLHCSLERPRTGQCQSKQCLVTTSTDKYQGILKLVFTAFSVSRLILGEYFDQIRNSNTQEGRGIILSLILLLKYTLQHSLEECPTRISADGTGGEDSRHEFPNTKGQKGKINQQKYKTSQTQSTVKSIKKINGGGGEGKKSPQSP